MQSEVFIDGSHCLKNIKYSDFLVYRQFTISYFILEHELLQLIQFKMVAVICSTINYFERK